MSKPLSLYLGRITPWQSTHLRFAATVSGTLEPIVTAAAVVETLPGLFDLDTAIGAQLDATGLRIGASRNVPLPIPNAYFSWDVPLLGWEQGVWRDSYDLVYGITSLDDTTYRKLLKAVVLANHWDGTVSQAQAIYDAFFTDPETFVFVQDGAQAAAPQDTFAWDTDRRGWEEGRWPNDYSDGPTLPALDLTLTVCIAGKIPAPVFIGLLAQNALKLKPAGVSVEYAITSVDRTPLFGFDMDNEFVAGWEDGAWPVSPRDFLEMT